MATPVIMPRLGNTVETCLIVAWNKKSGDPINKGDIICEVETDKAIFEIEAPETGTILDIFFKEGEDVPVLTNIAVIGSPGETYDEYKPDANAPNPEAAVAEEKNRPGQHSNQKTGQEKIIQPVQPISSRVKTPGISPRAKSRANRLGIDIQNIRGTGPEGRIIERDIMAIEKTRSPLTPLAKSVLRKGLSIPEEGTGIGKRITAADITKQTNFNTQTDETIHEVPLKGIRKIIADRMLNSLRNSAQLTLHGRADARKLLELRKELKSGTDSPELNKITINDLVLYSVVKSLTNYPDLNSLLLDEKILYHSNIHLGFAVDTPRGLMVPVIKNAQNLNLLGMSTESKRLASGCLQGNINPDDLNGGTFTVTNLGKIGVEFFTPVLNLPQTGILGIGKIDLKPIRTDFGVEYIPHIYLSLTIDHRVINRATGARFLQ